MHELTAVHTEMPVEPPAPASGGVGAIFDCFLREAHVRVLGFGRFYRGVEQDWTLRHLQSHEDGKRAKCSATKHLPAIVAALGVTTTEEEAHILAPSPVEFNAQVCRRAELAVRIPLAKEGGVRAVIYRGAKADGCLLKPGELFALSAAGCAAVVLWNSRNKHLAVGHAGLKSLLQEKSIVEALLWTVGANPGDEGGIAAYIAFPIAPENYLHQWNYPNNNGANKTLCEEVVQRFGPACVRGWGTKQQEEGMIDLTEIILAELRRLHVPRRNIDLSSMPDRWNTKDHELWYTTRGSFPQRRNLILIARYS